MNLGMIISDIEQQRQYSGVIDTNFYGYLNLRTEALQCCMLQWRCVQQL